jgi:streptogramin lyase
MIGLGADPKRKTGMAGARKTEAAFMRIAACAGKRLSQCFVVVLAVACSGKPTWANPVIEYSITPPPTSPYSYLSGGITAGPDGNLWFTEQYIDSQIWKVTTTGTFTDYSLGAYAEPTAITAGPDGNLWFAQNSSPSVQIGTITTTGTFTGYPIPPPGEFSDLYGAAGITAGPDGNLWFTENESNYIVKVTTTGAFTAYPIPTASSLPYGITGGPDGNLWFTEQIGKIGKVTPTGTFTEYPVPGGEPGGITVGPDGNLWFTERVGKVGKITTTGTVTVYTITSNDGPWGITAGPDGNLWVTENGGIGRITTMGAFTEYPIPTTNSGAFGITAGPDGNLWFTEDQALKIGVLNPLDPPPTTTPTNTSLPTNTPTTTPTATITPTPAATNTPTTTPTATICAATPLSGCRTAAKSLLLIAESAETSKDKLLWKWVKGQATTQAEFGNPTTTAAYAFCVYDGSGFLLGAKIPPSATNWSALASTGYSYNDGAGSADGIDKVLLKGSTQDNAKALLKAKGSNVPLATLGNLPLPVTVQLHNQASGLCLEGVYTSAGKNTTSQFKAKAP